MMPEHIRVPGRTLVCSGEEWLFAPLNFAAAEQYQAEIEGWAQLTLGQQMRLAVSLAHASLARNYPRITREAVADMLGLEHMEKLLPTVLALNDMPAATDAGESTPAPV